MAQNSGLSIENCLKWNTERPFLDVPRQSPSFSFLGSDWYFCFRLENRDRSAYNINTLYLFENEKKEPSKEVSISVFLKENYSFIESKWIKQITRGTQVLSFVNNGNIGLWTVYCVFSSESPIELHVNRSETMSLLNSSDLDLTQTPTESSIFSKAQLAACAHFDCQSGLETLSFDLNKLLEQKSSSDVTLNCGDDTFHAHRLILSARSEVFATMFRNPMVENETGVIDITDIDGEIFKLLLNHMYSGKVPDLNVDNVESLYIASDKYAIHNLKVECSKWMLRNLTADNCLEYLLLAHSCSDDRLEKRLVAFVGEVLPFLKKESWLKFREEHPILAMCVIERRAFSK